MAKNLKTISVDGEYWFSAKYAAELLGTTRKKIEAMAVRELVRALDSDGEYYVAEADVTRLRRDPEALTLVKEASKMPAHPRKGEQMPKQTAYVGDARVRPVAKRVGNPLKDSGY